MSLRHVKVLAFGAVLVFGLLALPHSAADAGAAALTNASDSVARATLGNGLRVVIVRDALAPMVTTQMTYLAGGYETSKGFPGTAHALEHMMFRGSKGLTGAQLNEMTGKMGGENNAFTTNDATQYSFDAPAPYLDILLRIEASRMRGALLTEKDWNLEKGAIEQEVARDISNPGFLAFEQAEKVLYAGTGYASDPLGTRPSFDRTTARSLRSFYDRWYQPANAVFVIVGDIDPQATLDRVRALFGPIPSRPIPARKPLTLNPVSPRTIMRTTPSGTGLVQFLYRMPGELSKDHAAAQVLVDVLNNSRSELAELAAQGKVLSAGADTESFSRGGIGVVEVGFPKGEDGRQASALLDGVVDALLENGVSADLVEAAKRSELAEFELQKNSASSVASAWSRALAWTGVDSPEAAEQRLQDVKVDDVNRVARAYLRSAARVTVVLAPDANGKRPPGSSGFGGTESFGTKEPLDVPLPDWAAQTLAKLEMPHWTLEPTQIKLANGITLVVQPETVSKTVTVVGHVDHNAGLQEPKDREGVGELLASLFDYGTTTLDRTAFHAALDAIAAAETGGDDFSLVVPSASFDRGMQLLADDELNPALPQQAFEVQQQSLARTLAGELQSPRYKTFRALRERLLPVGDSGLREATPATVEKLQLADVRNYFHDTYRPDLTTIVVIGDVTPDQARVAVEKYFGPWKAEGPRPDVIPPNVPLNPPGHAAVPNPYAAQDRVVMGEMLPVDLHNPDRYALKLGNDVLGGNGFASRLMTEIRVGHGYAYGAGSAMEIDRARSVFYVQYGSDPGKVAQVDALILANIKAMQRTPISDDELTNARQYEIRSIPLQVASVERIARSLLAWSFKGEPLDQPMVAARHYLGLTAEQVEDAFARYLLPEHLVRVVQGPAPGKH